MREDDTRLRQKAVELMRGAMAAWMAFKASGFRRRADGMRFVRAANRAETTLFRVVCGALDDPAPRVTYGQIASLRSLAYSVFTGRSMAYGSVSAARGALWAFDRDELSDPDPRRIAQLMEEPPAETEFVSEEGMTGLLFGEDRVVGAAEARLNLAERLVRFQPRPPTDATTPQDLDATFRARDKVYRTGEAMVWDCQLGSCRGRDAAGEALILAAEAAYTFSVLANFGNRFGPEDNEKAEQRCNAVLNHLSST